MDGILKAIELEKKALHNLEKQCERIRMGLDDAGIEILSLTESLKDLRMETDQLSLFTA